MAMPPAQDPEEPTQEPKPSKLPIIIAVIVAIALGLGAGALVGVAQQHRRTGAVTVTHPERDPVQRIAVDDHGGPHDPGADDRSADHERTDPHTDHGQPDGYLPEAFEVAQAHQHHHGTAIGGGSRADRAGAVGGVR